MVGLLLESEYASLTLTVSSGGEGSEDREGVRVCFCSAVTFRRLLKMERPLRKSVMAQGRSDGLDGAQGGT